ncbi:MAG: hypothetical protein ACAH59_02320, partial [Pseudobdellovibrionaceae bacterium]
MSQTQQGQRPEILYFGQPFDFLKTASRPDEDLVYLQNPQNCFQYLNEPRAAVLMAVVPDGNIQPALEILEKFEQESPKTSRILVVQGLTAEQFKTAVNHAHVHFCVDQVDFKSRWREILDRAVQKYHRSNARSQLMKESTRQFRELEALNSSLEKIVLERTQHIETSKEEEDEKLNKVRSLIRLIKELAQTSSFEELLLLLRKEFRKFHKVGDPILVYQAHLDRVEFISFQSGQILFTHKKDAFPFTNKISMAKNEMLKCLANHFGRPLIRALYIPLEMKESSYHGAQAGLCLEANLSESELELVVDFVRERVQSIAIT